MRPHFTIDLRSKGLEICEYAPDLIKSDMKLLGVKNALDLDLIVDFNQKIFKTERDAETWRSKFLKTLRSLDSFKILSERRRPLIAMKRRYIVLSILGEKRFTRRTFKRNWSAGQEFYIHDQRSYVLCRLSEDVVDDGDGLYTYHYEVI